MARRFLCVKYILLTMLQIRTTSAGALEKIDVEHVTCGQVLADCSVKDVALPGMKAQVKVWRLDLQVFLCCTKSQDCVPCLQVNVTFTIKDQNEDQEVSGDDNDEDDHSKEMEKGPGRALWEPPSPKRTKKDFDKGYIKKSTHSGKPYTEYSLRVCYSYPGFIDRCKEVTFTLSHSALVDQPNSEMWLRLFLKPVPYGSPVNIKALSTSETMTIPSLEEVCSPNLDDFVEDCEVPKLQALLDEEKDVALLQLDHPNRTMVRRMPVSMTSHMYGSNKADSFKEWVWWTGKNLRREICPFINNKELFQRMWQNNVSMSMQESQMNMENSTSLSWIVTAPCQLEGELWLCRKTSAEGDCEEVNGSRQRMHNQAHGGSTDTIHGFRKEGQFINVNSHPALCVQMWIQGMDTKLDPICPFTNRFIAPRNQWTLVVPIGILIISLAIFGAYAIHVAIKGYVWRWLKDQDIRGAVGGGHIVLLYPPDGDQALSGLVCRLATSLSSLGFSVSLDLWSRSELSVLGPVPWLHSRLDRLQRQGGKVVVVLTQAAWEKAEDWCSRSWERDTFSMGGCDEEPGAVKACRSTYSDVFSASLSCILADYLQGRAGERFTLVQFESLPPKPPGGGYPLPELFRGLQLFSLPSQSLAFLTELAFGQGKGAASGRRKRAGGLRAASRALAGGLRGFAGGSAVLRLTGLPQDCVCGRVEDPWEAVPLQQCATTSPSSPDTEPKTSGMNWV